MEKREPLETILTSDHTVLPADLRHKNDKPNRYNVAAYIPSNCKMSLNHKRLQLIAAVLKLHLFFFVFPFFCPSHSGSTVKIEMSYKMWQDANMWLPEGIWKRSCWFCNCRERRHPSHFHPRKKKNNKKNPLKSWTTWGMLEGDTNSISKACERTSNDTIINSAYD